MTFSRLSAAAAIALCIATPAFASAYVSAQAISGLLLVNVKTGAIIFCPGTNSGTSPTGTCAKIGTFSNTRPFADMQVTVSPDNPSFPIGFVTNTDTGVVYECVLTSSNGSPNGSCTGQSVPP